MKFLVTRNYVTDWFYELMILDLESFCAGKSCNDFYLYEIHHKQVCVFLPSDDMDNNDMTCFINCMSIFCEK